MFQLIPHVRQIFEFKMYFTTSGKYEDFEDLIFVANLIIVKLSLDVTTNDLRHTYTSISHGSKPSISSIKNSPTTGHIKGKLRMHLNLIYFLKRNVHKVSKYIEL